MTVNREFARRQFLRGVVMTAGGVAAMSTLRGLELLGQHGRVYAQPGGGSYGPLHPTPDLRDGVKRIALPRGFKYRSFSHAGEWMSDGNRVPLAHDGMAVFNMPDARFRLLRNHEDRNAPGAGSTAIDGNAYDTLGGGGTTTLVVNPFTRELERDFISVTGTIVNCAGGVTPWGSWITCEETNAGIPQGWSRQHGYCFEVPASAESTVPAIPLPAMGRFSHEALAVDPRTGILYQTEDSGDSGFYRFTPNTPGVLINGGVLEMLKIKDVINYDTRTAQTAGVPLPVEWVPIGTPDPAGQGSNDVYDQGFAGGAAIFTRLEGCWYGNGAIYFDATSGGDAGEGQIWEYRPDSDGGYLTLIFESSGPEVLNNPDNLAFSPHGSILLCEDGDDDQYLRGLTLDGHIFDFALNLQTDHEWAGATFAQAPPGWNDKAIRGNNPPIVHDADRITLFVNRQGSTSGNNPPAPGDEGMTFAIWGPWNRGAL
jgi:secreted PhoX family phosphatase